MLSRFGILHAPRSRGTVRTMGRSGGDSEARPRRRSSSITCFLVIFRFSAMRSISSDRSSSRTIVVLMCVYVNELCFREPCFGTGVSPSLNSPSVVAGRRSASAVAAGSTQAVTFPLPPPAQEYCARRRQKSSVRSHCATYRRRARARRYRHRRYRSGGAWGRFRRLARTPP